MRAWWCDSVQVPGIFPCIKVWLYTSIKPMRSSTYFQNKKQYYTKKWWQNTYSNPWKQPNKNSITDHLTSPWAKRQNERNRGEIVKWKLKFANETRKYLSSGICASTINQPLADAKLNTQEQAQARSPHAQPSLSRTRAPHHATSPHATRIWHKATPCTYFKLLTTCFLLYALPYTLLLPLAMHLPLILFHPLSTSPLITQLLPRIPTLTSVLRERMNRS